MPKKQSQQEFINKSKYIFGDVLDYSNVSYIDSRTEIILICKKHGDFKIKPKDHISYKRGCSICSGVRYNTQTFLEAAKMVHKDKFDYSKISFIGIKVPVIIGCKIHGDFSQTPDKHLNRKQG